MGKTILDYSCRSIFFFFFEWDRVRSELLDLGLQFAGFRSSQ